MPAEVSRGRRQLWLIAGLIALMLFSWSTGWLYPLLEESGHHRTREWIQTTFNLLVIVLTITFAIRSSRPAKTRDRKTDQE